MARNTNIKLRRSATAGAIPTTSNLDLGELALNTYDGKLYMKTTEASDSEVVQIGSATDSYHKVRKSQTLVFNVTVVSKNSDHIYYNQGSSAGYHIDGLQSPRLHLTPGNTYRFDQSDSSNSGHPLRFYYEANKTTEYTGGTSGVTTSGTPGSAGAYTQISVTDDTPLVLHYQCSNHGYMGNAADFGTRNFTGFDTADLNEGTNLYFTNARVDARLEATDHTIDGNGTSGGVTISDGNVQIKTGTGSVAAVDFYCESNNAHRVRLKAPAHSAFSGNPDVVLPNASGTLALTSAIPGNTDSLSEGSSNLYFTNARVESYLDANGTTFPDNVKAQFGGSNDLQIFHDGSDSFVKESGTGNLNLASNGAGVHIINDTDSETMATFHKNGAVTLYYDNSAKIATTSTGVSITGNIVGTGNIEGGSSSFLRFAAGSSTTPAILFGDSSGTGGTLSFKRNSDSAVAMTVAADGDVAISKDLTITGDLTVNGTTTTLNTATLDVEDKNITLNKGSGDTSGSANGAGITIQDAVNSSTDATILWDATNDKFTFSHPIHPTNILINDNNKIRLGNSQDLEIFHDGNHSRIKDAGTGNLVLNATNLVVNNSADSANMLKAIDGGAVELYHNNVKKFETTATGVQTVGTVNVNGAYTLPTSDGSANQVLQTDGSGTLSFATVSAGGGGTVSEAFKNIAVSGQTNIVADSATDTLTFAAGSNITLTTTPGTDTLTIAASGGEVTVQDEGSGLSTAATTLNFVGAGVTASGSGATKTITIPGGGGEVFKTIAVSGQSDVVADSATDTLTLAAGSGMTIATNASSDTITFTSSGTTTQSAVFTEFIFTPSSSTTTFTGSDANSNTLSYTVGAVDVFLNGIKLQPTTDFTASNGSSIVLVNAAGSGDVLQINAYTQVIGFGDSSLSELSGDGTTTAFTIAANPNNENNTQVYIDGVYQEKATYSVSGTTLTFSTAPANGTSIEVVIGSRNVTIADVSGLTVSNDLTVGGDTSITGATDITGNLDIAGKLRHIGDTDNYIHFSAADTQSYVTGNSTRMQIANSLVRFNQENNNQDFAVFSSNNDDMLYVDASADGVGIGTNTPASALHVKTAVDNSLTQGLIIERSANSDRGYINYQGGAFQFRSTIGDPIAFGETNTEHMRIAPTTGNVGIGTTSPGVSLDIGSNTDAIRVPNGTTAQRPTAALGQLRYNTTTSQFEGYADGAWGAIGGGGDAFGTIAVSGQSNVVADQENDTLTLVGAGGITITTTAGTDTVTLTGQTSVNPFTTDLFTTSNASTTAFTLSVTPPSEDNLIVFLEGAYQNKNSYSLSGTTLTLDSAPASGAEVVVHIIQNGVVGAGHVVDEFTGDGSDTTFTLSVEPLNENNTFVYLDGVYQEKSVYSVSGTTLTFATAPVNGHSIEVVTPQVAQVNQPAVASIDNVNMFSGLQASEITSTTMTTTSATTIATHAAATYRTVKYLVQLTQGTDYHSTEVNLIHDGSTVYITEYGTLFDNAVLGTLSATISSGNILLQLTPGSNSSLTAKVVSTAIPV